jgi:hypothetical protein
MGVDNADCGPTDRQWGRFAWTVHTYSHITQPDSSTVTRLFQYRGGKC